MAKYHMYVVSRKNWQDCEIVKKGFAKVRDGVTAYNIHGVAENGDKACNNVAKEVWNRFDVPIIEYTVRKKKRRNIIERELLPKSISNSPVSRSRKKVLNDEIEKWLAEKYNVDADKENTGNGFAF